MKTFRLCAIALSLLTALAFTQSVSARPALLRLSRDPYTNASSQHRTQVEPDTFSYGSTMIAVFQVGRFFDGGSSNIGWATTNDNGATWTNGFLPNTTVLAGGTYDRISDPSIAYDAKHAVWIANTLGLDGNTQSVLAHRSTDNGLTWGDPILIDGPDNGYDKNWIACDNTATSPYYGNCYAAWDDAFNSGAIHIAVSNDGGLVWSTHVATGTSGLGVQPIALPNGTVVIPYLSFSNNISVIRSTNGGASWSAPQIITQVIEHNVAGALRTSPLPSAEMDGAGRIYLVWQDCRFILNCAANDIVMTTSNDGASWSEIKRIPLDKKNSGIDHFIPGIGADPNTSGNAAHLALAYYFYPESACTVATCRLRVGFATSHDGGATWSKRIALTPRMKLKWQPDTTLGYMVGDYISTSFLDGKAFPVFANALEPTKKMRQAMYTPTGGLPIQNGIIRTIDEPIVSTASDHESQPIPIRQ